MQALLFNEENIKEEIKKPSENTCFTVDISSVFKEMQSFIEEKTELKKQHLADPEFIKNKSRKK